MALFYRYILIVLFFHCVVLKKQANAQLWRYVGANGKLDKNAQKQDAIYIITSWEGVPCKVRVVRKVLADHVIRIKLPTDSLRIGDTMGIDTVFALGKNFLMIQYSPRGGSNDGYQNTLILSVSKGKFCIAMDVMSQHVYGEAGPEGIYDVKVKLMDKDPSKINLLVNVHDVDSSTYKGAKHHDKRNKFVLNYDARQNIFYNAKQPINTTVSVWDTRTYKVKPRHINGNYPVIKLGDQEYFFINTIWYSGGKDPSTGKYSFVPYCERLGGEKKL